MHNAYIMADIMTYGAQKECEKVEQMLKDANIDFYSARLNKEINDKQNVNNDYLAERIFLTDTQKIVDADLIVYLNPGASVGATVELGQVVEYNRWAHRTGKVKKYVIAVSSDIRRTSEPEVGDRRSFSYNAYLYGAVLKASANRGIITLDELPAHLELYKKQREEEGTQLSLF